MSDTELDTLKQKGNQAFKDGDLASAKNLYSDAIALADKSSDVYATLLCNRAACHIKLLEWKSCIEDCSSAIAINPSLSKALYRRALAFDATNEYSRAFLDLNTLLRYDPKNSEAINLMRKVKSQVLLEQADASQVKSILDNVQKDPKHLLDGIKTLIGLTYDDKNHAIDFARKGGIAWIMSVINKEYKQSLQSGSDQNYDLSLLMAALRLLSACSNHKDFVLKYVDVNNNDNGLFNDNRFMRNEIQQVASSGKISLISVCSLLEHYDSTVVQIVIVFMMSNLKVVPASAELLLLDNIKAVRAKKSNTASESDDAAAAAESSASASIVVDADIRYSLEPDTVQAVVCGFKAALKAVHVDIFSLIADSLCAFLSEHPDYFEPARTTDTRLENLIERKIRLRERRIFKGRSVAHSTAAVGCGLISLLVDLLDHDSHSSVRQSAASCLGKLVNFFDNEEKIKGKLQPYLKGRAAEGEADCSESKVVELPPEGEDSAPPSLSECRRRAALTAVLLISLPEVGAWALSLPGGVPQLLFLVSTMDPRCQELAAEVMCLAASNDAASSQLSSIVANGTLTTLLHSPYPGTRAAAASTITKLSLKAKALSEDSAEVSQILNTVLAVLKSANNQKTTGSSESDKKGSGSKELTSFSALDEIGEKAKKLQLKKQKEDQQALVLASDNSASAAAGNSSAAVTMTSVERAIEVLAAMVGKTFIKEEIVHGSFRVVSCVAELAKLDLDVRSTAAYGFTHIFAALTVTNSELRAKALAEKDITPAQFEQMQELQRIKTKDEEGNVIEEKKEDSDPDSNELCKRRIQRIVAVNSISTLVRYLSSGSAQTKETAARTLRQICVEETSRGLMLQQGGFKACTTEANDEDNQKTTRMECAHVVAKTLVTTNPNLLSEHQRLGAIKPLVMLCRETDSSFLQQFEALLALTNLLSCGSDEHDRFTSERGVQAVHYLIFSDNLMVRRAAMETLCNMSSHEGLLKLLKDGEKVKLWLGLAEDWNNSNSEPADGGAGGVTEAFLTARAAAGTLAGAAGEAEVAAAMVGQDCARTVVALLESENKELVHRALVIVLELLGHGKRQYAEHLMGGGVIQSIGLVTKMGEPFLADLAMKCAQTMSDLLKEQKDN